MRACGDIRAVETRDGRRLGVRERGVPDGRAVLFLHGAIGAVAGADPELDAILEDLDVRYLLVDRPGFGASDPCPGRTVLGFAHDVEDLAGALGLARLAVLGVSAGAPYALACAHALPALVPAVAVVSGLGPVRAPHRADDVPVAVRLGLAALARHPRLATALGDAGLRAARRRPALLDALLGARAVAGDRVAVADAAARALVAERFLAAAAGGVAAMVEDYRVCTRPWGFSPEAVHGTVQLWHGMRDPLVPVDDALALAMALPACRVALDPDEGHFFLRRRIREILGALVGHPAAHLGGSRAEP